jgi:hypothetical protein
MKQPNKFKLTPQIHKQLVELAKDLPALQQLSPTGKPLFRAACDFVGTDLTAHSGRYDRYKQKIIRKQEPILVNHQVELIDKYQKRGMPAVDAYVAKVREIAAQHEENQPHEVPAT